MEGIENNSNLYPYCRVPLCERWPRRANPVNPDLAAERDTEYERLTRSRDIMDVIDVVHAQNFEGEEGSRESIVDSIFEATNAMLARNGVRLGFMGTGDESRSLGWVAWEEE
jgi:hypothetical protein